MAQTSVGEVGLDLKLNQQGFNRQLSSLTGIAKKAGAAMAAAFSVKALVGFGKQAIELGSDLAEVQNVVDVTFPRMSKQVDAFAQSAAASFGLSETMAKKYTGTFGAMAKAFGFTEKEAYSMSTALTGLAGDVASFYNLSQDEAYTKLKSVFTGETESLKDLGVVMTQNALDQYALSHGYSVTTSAMSEQEKVALRYKFVMDQLALANGDFARTQDSWANQSRILALQWESFMASVGQGLINLLTPALKLLNYVMGKLVAFANLFKKFTGALTGNKNNDSGGSTLSGALTTTGKSADNTSTSLGKVGKAAKKSAKQAKKATKDLLSFDKITKLSKKTSTASSPSAGSSGGGGVGGGGLIDTGLNTAVKNQQKQGGKLSKIWNNARKALKPLKKSMAEFGSVCQKYGKFFYKNIVKPFGKWVIKKWIPARLRQISAAFSLMSKVLKFLYPIARLIWKKALAPLFKLLGKSIVKTLEGAALVFKGIGKVFEKMTPYVQKACSYLENFSLSDAWDGAKDKVSGVFESLGEWAMDKGKEIAVTVTGKEDPTFEDVKKAWENLKDKVAEVKAIVATKWSEIKGAWDALVGNVQDKIADMKAKIATKWSDISDNWKKITGNISDKTADMKAKIATKWGDLKDKWHAITGNIKDITANIAVKFTAASSAVKSWINTNIISKINSALKKLPIIGKKIKGIPKFAQGGFVKANAPQLAMIGDNRHQGEYVAPEDKMMAMAMQAAQMAAGSGGITRAEMQSIVNSAVNSLIRVMREMGVFFDGEEVAKLVNAGNKAINRRYSPIG